LVAFGSPVCRDSLTQQVRGLSKCDIVAYPIAMVLVFSLQFVHQDSSSQGIGGPIRILRFLGDSGGWEKGNYEQCYDADLRFRQSHNR